VELLLYRWSTLAQFVSDAMIMAFLLVLYRSAGRAELKFQVMAWAANAAALGITVCYWLLHPEHDWMLRTMAMGYVASKTAFACLLVAGVLALSGRVVKRRRLCAALLGCLVYGAGVALAFRSIDELGMFGAAALGVVLWVAVAIVVREKPLGWHWLAAGIAVRAAFAVVEALAYLSQLLSIELLPPTLVASYLAAHSSFDGAAEWMIVLGCVLAMYRIIAAELADSNREMSAAREHMRELAESDMLTGLANRRTLMPALRATHAQGAAILFFDLDDFKDINDRYGHQMGDACLKRFANILRANFRPGDTLIRYAGDEFIVVAPAVRPESMGARIAAARAQLGEAGDGTPPIGFSGGLAFLDADGDIETAVAAADSAMYVEKKRKRRSAAELAAVQSRAAGG
jgi:diguanylate cyclase (GGDEF)-like protein